MGHRRLQLLSLFHHINTCTTHSLTFYYCDITTTGSFQEIAARQQDEELRRHENQAEESRISLAKNKIRHESMEVALGERGKVLPVCD